MQFLNQKGDAGRYRVPAHLRAAENDGLVGDLQGKAVGGGGSRAFPIRSQIRERGYENIPARLICAKETPGFQSRGFARMLV